MKIVIAHFGSRYVDMAGGVEKVTCNLANEMIRRGHEVTILYSDSEEGNPFFYLDERVKQVNILFKRGVKIVSERLPLHFRILRELVRPFSQAAAQAVNAIYKGKLYGPRIKKYLEENPADVILSCSIPSAKYVIDDAGIRIPVVEMIHSHPDIQFPVLSSVERKAASRCSVMQILLPSGLKTAHQYFPELPIVVIGNAVFPATKLADPGNVKKKYHICCIGNIDGRKRQWLLAEAFSKIAKDFPDWTVEFWGGGSASRDGKKVKGIVESQGLGQQIHINGKTTHPDDVYAASDILCIPSRDEGWGLSLTEAMAAGLPVVGCKGCTGVEDLIDDGVDGLLVNPEADALAAGLRRLMEHPDMRRNMGVAARKAMEKYEPQHIWDAWENLLIKISKHESVI